MMATSRSPSARAVRIGCAHAPCLATSGLASEAPTATQASTAHLCAFIVINVEGRMGSGLVRHVALIGAMASLIVTSPLAGSYSAFAQATTPSRWAAVDNALGRTGAMQAGNVMKYSFPRSDLNVVVQGVTVKPALALGGWVAFMDLGGGQSMAMGDLVLSPDEVPSVMRELRQGGVEVTALHNHLIAPVMYMHIQGHGDATKVASAIRTALATTKTPLGAPGAPSAPSAAGLD